MPLEREFAESLVQAMRRAGWSTSLPEGKLPNPLPLTFSNEATQWKLLIHARHMTPQRRLGENPSDHHRPPGELHTQMIFDGDRKGAGQRNQLRFEHGAKTVLFGFYDSPDGYVIAAYDPEKHRVYGYSSSLQVKQQTLDLALRDGIAFQQRENGEVIVAFHIDELAQYVALADELHNLSPDIARLEEAPLPIRQMLEMEHETRPLPELVAGERRRRFAETARTIRDHNFKRGILQLYDRCAICGFQYDYVLEAAHIIPVAEGGTDTYDNGLGLCPNCHTMYDKGLILIDENYRIYINTDLAEAYDQIGRAGSLENLKQTLREFLWLPDAESYRPSPANLRRIFEIRRRS